MSVSLKPSMNTVELHRVQQEHATIRAKLHQVQSTLAEGPPDLIRDGARKAHRTRVLCVALARQLRAHVELEGRLAARCSMVLGRMGPEELAWLALEHHVDQEKLRILNQLLAHEHHGWVTSMGPLLLRLIGRLTRQMDAQEVELFPFMERVLAADGHRNGATHLEGGDRMRREGALEQLVTSAVRR